MLKPDLWVHVPTPQESAAVQVKAFTLGYRWYRRGQHVSHTERAYIHLNSGGELTHSTYYNPSYHTLLVTAEEFLNA